jgi:ATP/maltotriose-dependent transcriptional regulator MalT
LKTKSELIELQNEELIQSQEKLNDANLHLEDLVLKKTENIKEQNRLLLKYAYSNAHHVRGPIARALGLIQVSRLDTDLDNRWFFEKLEQEVKSADEIIRGLGRELANLDHLES